MTMPDFPVDTYTTALPKLFDVPPVNPSPNGLFTVTDWQDDPDQRWRNGVHFRGFNYGGDNAFGVWTVPGCGLGIAVDVTGTGTSTTWKFTYGGQQTAALTKTSTAADFRAALVALSNLTAEEVTVVQPTAPGPFIVSFAKRAAYSAQVIGVNLVVDVDPVIKTGERPEDLDPFEPITVWSYDECDPTAGSRSEIQRRVQQILRLEEQVAIEQEIANRLLTDAGSPHSSANLVEAIGYLEGVLAMTNTVGFIHVGAQWAAVAAQAQLLTKSGNALRSPLGHTLVFGGGYVDGLADTLVATSQPYGWRDDPTIYTTLADDGSVFAAVAERTVVIGYEAAIAAATIA